MYSCARRAEYLLSWAISFIGRLGRAHRGGHDLLVLQPPAVELRIVVQILPQGGSFQSETGKQSLGSRPRENLGVHLRVGLRCRGASHGPGGDRAFGAQSELAGKQLCPLPAHSSRA